MRSGDLGGPVVFKLAGHLSGLELESWSARNLFFQEKSINLLSMVRAGTLG